MAKPEWLKVLPPKGEAYSKVKRTLASHSLYSVCQGAHCPNCSECWGSGTAAFMVMGKVCTRNCRFCAVYHGIKGEPLDKTEPRRLAQAVSELGLKHVVITSVDRDDLKDFGSSHFAECVSEIKKLNNGTRIELLVPDFQKNEDAISVVALSGADIVGHNLETVRRLQEKVRDRRANYDVSLSVLAKLKKANPKLFTKSSLMLGLGEQESEVLETMDDLRKAGVDFITMGQYLQPSAEQLPVFEFITPERFKQYGKIAKEKGFSGVASGPFVRSSFMAAELFIKNTC